MISQHPYPQHPQLRRNVDFLIDRGVEVDLLCTREPVAATAVRPHPRLRVRAMPLQHRRTGPLRYVAEYGGFFAWALPRVCLLALRRRYDAVQVDNLPDLLVFLGWPPRLRGARVVFFMYELMPELTAARMALSPRHRLIRIIRVIERLATRWADRVVVVNESCRRLLAQRALSADRIVVVPNTQPRRSWPPVERSAAPVLITHTTLVARYGVQVAIRAVALLTKERPDVILEVIGEGEYRETLQALASEVGAAAHVTFLGARPWVQTMTRVSRATIGLVPILADGYGELLLPNKLLEYVALGVPVVCSRLAAIAEHFPPDALAYFEPGDAAGLADRISRLLRDPDAMSRQVERARRALEHLSWESAAPRYLEALGIASR